MFSEKAGLSRITLAGGECMTVTVADKALKFISTGSIELDRKLGGGIPHGTLMLVEGAESSGKSTLVQQLLWSSLNDGELGTLYITEQTIQSLLRQMDSLGINIRDYFLMDRIQVYPVSVPTDSIEPEKLFCELFDHIEREDSARVVVVDSLTTLVSHLGGNHIQEFFSKCKRLCDEGKVIICTAHSSAFDEDVLTRIRSICDAFIRLDVHNSGTVLLKTMEVAKIRGAEMKTGTILGFDVEPGRGIRIIPISRARA